MIDQGCSLKFNFGVLTGKTLLSHLKLALSTALDQLHRRFLCTVASVVERHLEWSGDDGTSKGELVCKVRANCQVRLVDDALQT